MLTREQFAGKEYAEGLGYVSRGAEHELSMVAMHIHIMINGTRDFPDGGLWRVREVPPEGKRIELDNFLDYLTRPARDGLGFKSAKQVQLLMEGTGREGQKALAAISKELPNWDELVKKAAAKEGAAKAQQDKSVRAGRPNKNHNNVMNLDQGNSQSYTLRRLARKRPDLLKAFERGEISANAAAIKAGFRKATWTAPCDPVELAKAIERRYPELRVVWRQA